MTKNINRGFCDQCAKIVPVHHQEKDGKVFLVKECPDCGSGEALVSTSAQRYNSKRELTNYRGEAEKTCSLKCDSCNIHRTPSLVFVDVTNRCNMNCPICLANIPAMGFRFDPPKTYFEKIFSYLGSLEPKPKIMLFGGEPTVRDDLIEIIHLAAQNGMPARVVTNGLRLADEEYCRQLLSTPAELMFSFDGRDPEIYRRTRKHPTAYEKKMKALENVRKHSVLKNTIMCCVGIGVNDEYMADMIKFCHEGQDYIAALDLIPLTATWGPEAVDAENTTVEDVERIMQDALPGMEFFPVSMLYRLPTIWKTFNLGTITFGGAHPNCETVSFLVSDGREYRPLQHYLKASPSTVLSRLLDLDAEAGKRFSGGMWQTLGSRARQLALGWQLFGFMRTYINFANIFPGGTMRGISRIVRGLIKKKPLKDLLRSHTCCHNILRVIVLPFEEKACLESARLVDCPAAFAFEDPESRDIRVMPVCSWVAYKNDILRATAQAYEVDPAGGNLGME